MRAWARWYFDECQWDVFPVFGVAEWVCSCEAGPDCTQPTKHPMVTGWTEPRTGLSVDLWWERWPEASIAVHCNRIMVVDLDGEEGIQAFRELREQHPPMPLTPTVRTPGGGYHLYFKRLEGAKNKVRVLPGVDIRADHGYVIAPPSEGIKGVYEWVKGRGPWEVPLADAPPWLAKMVTPPQPAYRSEGPREPQEPWEVRIEDIPMIQAGTRNNMLAHHAGHVFRAYSGAKTKPYAEIVDRVEAKMLEINEKRCAPPLREREVREIVKSLARLG